MKEPTLKNNIDEVKPIFKSWNEVSQNVSSKYATNSLGEMAFWHDPGVCNYTISIPLAIAGSNCCHGAGGFQL